MKKNLMDHASRLKGATSKVSFIEGGGELLDCIGPLWKKQAQLHAGFSPHFSKEFSTMTFIARKQELQDKAFRKQMHIIVAQSPRKMTIGYAVGTINSLKVAEIDSLFLEKSFRIKGTGSRLVAMMIAWFERHRVSSITVNVAVGNESTLPFYHRLGFFPRVTTLVLKP
jgi:GNAT superfamily N-acetyltransferase